MTDRQTFIEMLIKSGINFTMDITNGNIVIVSDEAVFKFDSLDNMQKFYIKNY